MDLVIASDGTVRCLYAEAIPLAELGALAIQRASWVEPDPGGRWLASLRPVGGPTLGPFPARSAALAAERAWLTDHWLNVSACETNAGDPFHHTYFTTPPGIQHEDFVHQQ